MSLITPEALAILNHTIFRPGWKVSAHRAGHAGDQVLLHIETETVDSSFVTRGGEYRVPLTERAAYLIDAGDYETPQALLFAVLTAIRELQDHEDREFLRTWHADAGRWGAPFHSHTPEGQQAWEFFSALSQPAMTRLGQGGHPACSGNIDGDDWCAEGGGPRREVRDHGCNGESDYVCWAGNDGKGGQAHGRVASAQCDNAEDRDECWNGEVLKPSATSPCNDQTDADDDIDGGGRVLARVTPAGCNEAVVECGRDDA